MYYQQLKEINEGIERTGKVIISLGCSFAQGQGAIPEELLKKYNWEFEKLGKPIKINDLTDSQKTELLAEYKSLQINPYTKELDWTFLEYEHSFVYVLCKKYFNDEYTPINLGIRGCGNRATIKELFLHPEIHWSKVKEIIVIYLPSGLERFDFIADTWNDHHRWKCMWPHYNDIEKGPRRTLWEGYAGHVFSDKFEVIEQIVHVQELLMWCNYHNAKLIVTPAFDKRYNRQHFLDCLEKVIERDMDGNIKKITTPINKGQPELYANYLIDLFPWDKTYLPDGCPTLADMLIKQEHPEDWENHHFFEYLGTGSKNLWITSCAHPSAKGHDLFAKFLYEHITGAK
jgi:hypothetical protein